MRYQVCDEMINISFLLSRRINGYVAALTDAFIDIFTNYIGWGLDKFHLLFPRGGVIHASVYHWPHSLFGLRQTPLILKTNSATGVSLCRKEHSELKVVVYRYIRSNVRPRLERTINWIQK